MIITREGPAYEWIRLLPYRCLSVCNTDDSLRYRKDATSSIRSNCGGFAYNTIKSRKSNYRTLYIQNALANGALCSLPPANEVWGKVICLQACVCPQGGCLVRGCACSGGCACWRPPPDGHCCGRYASYWNASLFLCSLVYLCLCNNVQVLPMILFRALLISGAFKLFSYPPSVRHHMSWFTSSVCRRTALLIKCQIHSSCN